MNKLVSCPSLAQLVQLVHGQIPPAGANDLIEHLLHCRECAVSLSHFQLSDSLLARLKERAGAEEKTLLPEIVERLTPRARGEGERPTPSADERHAATVGESDSAEERGWDRILQPAMSGDELGWLGPYRVLKVLGTGGMGRVFLAEETSLSRQVALKVMSPALLDIPAARDRFLREARAAATLQDDHIVTIYQVGQADDVPYLAMELLQGESLADRLLRERSLVAAESVRIAREIAEGLAAAHDRGLVHRDIKPANIWLERPERTSSLVARPRLTEKTLRRAGSCFVSFKRVKILDFGLARAAVGSAALTTTGQVVGTPHYMSPEQARGENVDARSDLFSLGCVLYRMLAGREPFGGTSVMAVLTALAVETPARLSDLKPSLPEGLVSLVERLLCKSPAGRPQSAHEVVGALRALEEELDAAASAIQTIAAPPGLAARAAPPRRAAWPRGRAALVACLLVGLISAIFYFKGGQRYHARDGQPLPAGPAGPPIKVGILHSLSGTMADSEMTVVDATRLAIEEINARGGIRGRKIQCVLRDGESDAAVFAAQAERLIREEQASVLFGCWTSAARKGVKAVVEKHDHLLLYPLQYEGMEASPNIIYLGGTPNQLILPAVQYCFANLHMRRFFLVGSDYVFPRAANAIIKDELAVLGAEVVGEKYVPLGETALSDVVDAIVAARPDIILNTINGDSNRSFFRLLRAAGITPDRTPTLSFSISEPELRFLGSKHVEGDYAAWNYFMALPDKANVEFVARFRARYGSQRLTSDPMLAAYAAVHLWAEAVEKAGNADPAKVRPILREEDFDGPGGKIKIDPATQHAWRPFRLGRITKEDRFEIVWSSEILIRPEPFLNTRPREAWESFLNDLYQHWGGRWERQNDR